MTKGLGYSNGWKWINVYEMFCAIWYYFYKLKNMKNTHEGVLLLNCANGAKPRNASHI